MPAAPHILHVFPSFEPGGSQVRTTALMAAFGPEFRHSVLSMNGTLTAREMLPTGFELGIVEPPPAGGFFGTLRALGQRFQELAPDLLCTYNWGAIESVLAAGSLAKPPVIHHEDGFGPDEAHGLKRRRTWTRRYALKRATAVIVPSHNLGRIARKKWRVPEAQLHVVPNGVELEAFDAARNRAPASALREELGIPAAAFVVGSVGHLRAEKNYPRLVEALAEASELAPEQDWRLLLVGDGAERAAIEVRARALGVSERLHFAGHRENCAPALGAMDVFCLSSDTEQMPISLVEAMAAERPAVCTAVGDVALMLPAGSEELVVPLAEGARGLAVRLVALASDSERRTSLGRAGRTKAHAAFGFDTMRATYRDLYLEAMGRTPELEDLDAEPDESQS